MKRNQIKTVERVSNVNKRINILYDETMTFLTEIQKSFRIMSEIFFFIISLLAFFLMRARCISDKLNEEKKSQQQKKK
jgi:hypothetical protein